MTLCIIQGSNDFWSSSFVRAHIEHLKGDKVVLQKYYPDLAHNGRDIRYFHSQRPLLRKAEKLLPQFLYHRKITRWQDTFAGRHDAIAGFMATNNVDVILAEFGIHGANICPHAKALSLPVIVHFHGHDAHRDPLLAGRMEAYREMFEYADYLVSVSEFMTEKLVSMGADRQKIVYNPYGPRDHFFENQSSYDDIFLAIGRFTDIKAPHLTVLAFAEVLKEFPDTKLVMGGHGELLEACQTLALALGIQNNIDFRGALKHEEVAPLFQSACCFVQHSVQPTYGDSEGTPVAILEAGAAALPVVSTKHAGIPQAVIDGKTGLLVEERDIDGMAAAMKKLLKDRELCRQMGAAARDHIRINYNIRRHLDCLDGLVESVRANAASV